MLTDNRPAAVCVSVGDLRKRGSAFTLTELLVVMVILGLLASLLMPALRAAKGHAWMAKCVSNLRQIGMAFQAYRDEHQSKFPPLGPGGGWSFQFGGGDPDRNLNHNPLSLKAEDRPLWPYTQSRDLYRCPADRGMDAVSHFNIFGWSWPNDFEALGTSYKYNENPWTPFTREPERDPNLGIAQKPENSISDPYRYVLVHEPPATPFFYNNTWVYYFWHEARGPGMVMNRSEVRDRFISPALFVDGHAARHDFTQKITSQWGYPSEPAPNWYFYEPATK